MTDDEIRRRLYDVEDGWTERKSAQHSEEIRKTLVAFANSVPEGEEAVLFVGVANDCSIVGVNDPEKDQASITRAAKGCYPEIKPGMRAIQIEDKWVIAVIVRSSHEKPHFSGPAFIRKGSESEKANEVAFTELVASRSNTARPILEAKHKGEKVIVCDYAFGRNMGCIPQTCDIVECTPTYAVFQPLSGGTISADHRHIRISKYGSQLRVEIDY